jgi:hypothetical protein
MIKYSILIHMSESLDGMAGVNMTAETEFQKSPLEKQKFLTNDEIASIRSQQNQTRTYHLGDTAVHIQFLNKEVKDFKNQEHLDQTVAVLKSKEEGEAFVYERLLVNALIEQARIARRFGLPEKGLYLALKLDSGMLGATTLMDSDGTVNLLQLKKHIDILQRRGATEEQLTTELAGHVFHEAVHLGEDGLDQALLEGKSSLGELTTVTAQLAYYLDSEYTGPHSYDVLKLDPGIKKIQEGRDSTMDYDIVTCVGNEILNQSLREAYPDVRQETRGVNIVEANQQIISKLSDEQRQRLIPVLKKAIAQSADEKVFKRIITELKQDPKQHSLRHDA